MAQSPASARAFALPELVAAITQAAVDMAIGPHNFVLVRGAYTTAIFEPLPTLSRLSRVNRVFHYTVNSAAFQRLQPVVETEPDDFAIALSWILAGKLRLEFWFLSNGCGCPRIGVVDTCGCPRIGVVDTRPEVGGNDDRAHMIAFNAQYNQPFAAWRKIKAFTSKDIKLCPVINRVRFGVKAGISDGNGDLDGMHSFRMHWNFKRDATLGEVFDEIYERVTTPPPQLLKIERDQSTNVCKGNRNDENERQLK